MNRPMTVSRTMRFMGIPFCCLCVCAAIFSCARLPSKIALPQSSPLNSGPKYGVVVDDYLRVKVSPGPANPDSFYLRKGQIVEISATARFNDESGRENGLWHKIKSETGEGWVFSAYLEVHDTYAQAEYAVKTATTDVRKDGAGASASE
jgi:hypothetical protein